MKNEEPKINNNGRNKLFDQFSAKKKKSIAAFCLIAVMAFMWVRVLRRETPQAAEAAPRQEQLNINTPMSTSETIVSYMELPVVSGRNDGLTRDFFDADGWQNFTGYGENNLAGSEEVSVVSIDSSKEVGKKIAEKLRLEAIGLDENPQAFINGKVLSVGDKLDIRDGVSTYECEVVAIEENKVLVKCGNVEITLKITRGLELAD